MLRKLSADKALYRRFLQIAIPIIIQNGITNFVSMLDNIMVGQVGSLQMSGVSIVNGLMFVFSLCVFGAGSGAGIFTAQFFGSDDHEGIRYTFRFKVLACTILSLLAVGFFLLFGEPLIKLYLQGEGSAEDAALVLQYGKDYLAMTYWGFVPFALSNAYAGTLRETGQTTVPMVAGITAVLVNLVLNYVLIFGHFGAPELGVQGAAIATAISRYVELSIVAGWTHRNKKICAFIDGAYSSLCIPGTLLKKIIAKGTPLLLNEAFWSGGMAFLNQCYSTCGLDVVPAMNISSTIFNLASVAFISGGNTVGILMGQMLGAGNTVEHIRDTNRKLITANVAVGVVFGLLLASISGLFPLIYNTTDSIRQMATQLILICAVMMPIHSYLNATYFTLRSGGKAFVTFVFDSGYVWFCMIPVAFLLSRFTDLSIIPLYIICQCLDSFKCIIGSRMLKKGSWIQKLTVS
ncbi:MAG: MATE family efflux transporter [Oscillospiraceae bacterium]|nr:MATE family efflux transporter [Oscillospiraceae bacterium]